MTRSIWTATLARLYARQGLWEQAASIYRELLAREPERRDLYKELARAEAHLAEDRCGDLLRRWLDLLFHYRRLRLLRRIGRGS